MLETLVVQMANWPARDLSSTRLLLLVLAVATGMGGVVYEVLYLRHLTTWLGDMYYVHAAVLCVFLVGAGVGARLAHRAAHHLAWIEAGIGVYALALPALTRAFVSSPLSHPTGDPAVDALLGATALLAVPAVLIGFSVPLLGALLQRQEHPGHAFQTVYGLYHVGTCVSILLVEFVVVRHLGVRGALIALGSVDLLCALLVATVPALRPTPRPPPPPSPRRRRSDVALLAASVASAVFQGFQLKLCYALLQPHRENFAVCTAASLLGLAAGSWLVQRRQWPVARCWRSALFAMAILYALYPQLASGYRFYVGLLPTLTSAWPATTGVALVGGKLLWALLLGGVPMVFFGASIPSLMRDRLDVARDAGPLLMISGLGNAGGYLAYILVVHPHLPLFAAITVVAALVCAALLLEAATPRHAVTDGTGLGLRHAVAGLTLVGLLGVASLHPASIGYLARTPHAPDSIVTHFRSTADDASWIREPGRSRLTFNGLPSITLERHGAQPASEITGGVLPALVAPRRERALVIGLGSGVTAGALALLFGQVDIVEINRAFVPLLPELRRYNFDLARNPRAHIVIDDARHHLARSVARYDVILNAAPSPSFASAGKLYTREFFAQVRASLTEGGVYVSWFTPDTMSPESIRTLLATLLDVFPRCGLAVLRDQDYRVYNTVCGEQPLHQNHAALTELPAPLAATLAPVVVPQEPAQHLRCLVVSDDIGAPPSGGAISTDDRPVLEFQLSRLQGLALAPGADPIADGSLALRLNPRCEATRTEPAAPAPVELDPPARP